MFDMIFNGKSTREMAVAVTTRPSIPAPQMRGEWVDLGGVDGSLLLTDGTYENIEISVPLNYVCPRDKVGLQYRRLKSWIRGAGELSFTDDHEVYYRVKAAGIAEYERRSRIGAELQAVFVCDPYAYYKSGKYPIIKTFAANNTADSLYIENRYDEARPIYSVNGSLMANASFTLTVNGNSVSFLRDRLTIDTQRMAVYSDTDTPPGLLNNVADGDLDGLVLAPGTNQIKITGNSVDLTLELIPNWRSL